MYQNLLKVSNSDNKYLMCPDLWENKFEVMRSKIALDKIDLECAETVKA